MSKTTLSDSVIDTIWKFFASVKLSVVVLLTLAATSIVGTLVPQNESPMHYIQAFGESWVAVLNVMGIFDIYHCRWFRFLLCVLIINIVVCSINRLKSTWKIIFPKTPLFHHARFKNAANRQEWTVEGPPEKLKNAFETFIAGHFTSHRVDQVNKGFQIFCEKGRMTGLGVYAVHLSVLLMVAGGLIGSVLGFEGFVNIPEGETKDKIALINKNAEQNLGFSIRCNNFSVALYDSGMPKEYRSNLTILRNDRELVTKDIRVNDPLKVNGVSIFQASYGKVPAKSFTINFTEKDSGIEYEKQASVGETVTLPGDAGVFIVDDFKDSISFRGVQLDNIFTGRLIPKSGETEPVILAADYPNFDKMRGGKFIISISDVKYRYSTGLQINKDPGVPVVYAGFILMILGCYVTFFMFHQQFCIEIMGTGDKTQVTVSGVSGKNRPGMLSSTRHLAKELKKIGKKPEDRSQKSE